MKSEALQKFKIYLQKKSESSRSSKKLLKVFCSATQKLIFLLSNKWKWKHTREPTQESKKWILFIFFFVSVFSLCMVEVEWKATKLICRESQRDDGRTIMKAWKWWRSSQGRTDWIFSMHKIFPFQFSSFSPSISKWKVKGITNANMTHDNKSWESIDWWSDLVSGSPTLPSSSIMSEVIQDNNVLIIVPGVWHETQRTSARTQIYVRWMKCFFTFSF